MSLELEYRFASVSGGRMAYAELGEGPPVLLLHGFPTSSFLWRREAWLLAQRMRVIVPDLLGYGRSDKPREADLTEPAQAGYVAELLELLGVGELAVVGHDIGGAIGQMLALDAPGRVRCLVLLDTACFDVWPVDGVRMIQGATPEQETAASVEDIVRATFVLGVRHQGRLDEEAVRGYLRPWVLEPEAFFRAARAVSGKGLSGREEELRSASDRPVLLIWGEDDPFLAPELGERLQELLPGAALALLPGCSHFVTEDAPQTVGPLIHEYLRSRYLGGGHGHDGASGPVPIFLERPPPGFDEPTADD